MTVPAVWSDAARAKTLECAERAGLGDGVEAGIRLVTEPEAAALYALVKVRGLGGLRGCSVKSDGS